MNERLGYNSIYNIYKFTKGNTKAYFVTRFGSAKDATKIHVQALQGLTGEVAGKHDSKK